MPKLNDLEAILLASAAGRDNGSLLPAPANVADAGTRLTKAIATLIKRGFAEERETSDKPPIQRTDGCMHYGVFISEAGNAAIGVGDDSGIGGACDNANNPADAHPAVEQDLDAAPAAAAPAKTAPSDAPAPVAPAPATAPTLSGSNDVPTATAQANPRPNGTGSPASTASANASPSMSPRAQ